MTGSGYVDWQCEDPATDCPAGQLCCADGTWVDGGTENGMVCANFASHMTHTYCASSCGTGTIICETQAECTAIGLTACLTFTKAGNPIGACF
jgi:hypothetical protein